MHTLAGFATFILIKVIQHYRKLKKRSGIIIGNTVQQPAVITVGGTTQPAIITYGNQAQPTVVCLPPQTVVPQDHTRQTGSVTAADPV